MIRRFAVAMMGVTLLGSQLCAKTKIEELAERAEKGEAQAQFDLGEHYWPNFKKMPDGSSVSTSFERAIVWLRKAAEQNHALAQFKLGQILYQGDGSLDFKIDEIQSAQWLSSYLMHKGARKNLRAEAEFMLGMEYSNVCDPYWLRPRRDNKISFAGLMCGPSREGKHPAENNTLAAKHFRSAADADHAVAQYQLGRMYQSGRGVRQDYFEAARLYRTAIEAGFDHARGPLGKLCIQMGDYVAAHMWFNLASTTDDEWAAEERDDIAKLMTAAQIVQAQKMAREWEASYKK